MDLRIRFGIGAAALITASQVLAQSAPAPAQPPDQPKPAKDLNEIVCERQAELGSRLAAAKVCHTRAEWADLRSQDRHMVDQVQTQQGMLGK
jgi:hypothetical protein